MDKTLALKIQLLAVDKLSSSLKKIVGLGENGAQKLARLRREAKALNSQMSGASGNVTDLVNRQKALDKAISAQERLLKVENQVSKMREKGRALQQAGQANMMGGMAMTMPLILAAKSAMDFSSGMVDIQQKAELSNAEIAKMRSNILKAAQATHQMPEDMRAAVDVLAGFGMDPRAAARLAQPIGKLGTAFKVDLADGAAAAYANVNNLKLPLAQVGKAFDIMAAGGNAGAFEIKDMAKYFPELTAQAAALGQTGTAAVADLTAALQIARRGTGDAQSAATNINNLLTQINTERTISKFKKFGIDLPGAMKKAYAQGKTPLEAIAELTQKATGGRLDLLPQLMGNQQAAAALRMLVQDMGDYKAMRADIAKADGTTEDAFRQRELNDGMVAWSSFKATLATTALVWGTKLLPVASQFLNTLGPMIGAIGDFAQAHPQITSALLTMVGALGAAKIGIGALQFAFGTILGPVASAWKLFAVIGSVIGTAGLAIVGVGALIGVAAYLIYANWDKIKAAFWQGVAAVAGAWESLKGAVMAALSWWMGLHAQFLNIGKNIVMGIARGILSAGGAVWNALKSLVMGSVDRVKSLLGIKSPSRLFMEMGGFITDGLAIGVDNNRARPITAVGKLATGVAGAMAIAAPAAGAPASPAPVHITINVQQSPGEDGDALARRVASILQDKMRTQQRSAYYD